MLLNFSTSLDTYLRICIEKIISWFWSVVAVDEDHSNIGVEHARSWVRAADAKRHVLPYVYNPNELQCYFIIGFIYSPPYMELIFD